MLTKRIIPCLDIKDGRVVKGVNFENMRDAGDPIELVIQYSLSGADELVFLDISATNEKRKTLSDLVTKIARNINIPFTVGGGISSIDDVSLLLNSGADKISINSAAFKNPNLISDLSDRFGSQCIVVAIDTKFVRTDSFGEKDDWYVYLNGGKIKTEMKAIDWAEKIVAMGAGEILLTAMNNDGTKKGFANDITKCISEKVNVPIIASGGAGTMEHFRDAFLLGKADATLAASVFHYNEIDIKKLKEYLKKENISIRI